MADELADGIAKLAIKAPSKADFPAFGLNRETAVGMVPGIGEAATKALENLSDSKRELKIPQITTAAQLIGLFLLLGEENFKPKIKELAKLIGQNPDVVTQCIDQWLEKHSMKKTADKGAPAA